MIALVLAALLVRAQPETDSAASPAAETTPGIVHGRMPRLPPSEPPIPPGAAVIRNSGSTNTAAYTLVIAPDGATTVREYQSYTQKAVAAAQTRWLFARLQAAGSLETLGAERCMKSASFGSSTRVTWNGATSGDLSCSSDAASRELVRTINVIVTQLAIQGLPRPLRLRPL